MAKLNSFKVGDKVVDVSKSNFYSYREVHTIERGRTSGINCVPSKINPNQQWTGCMGDWELYKKQPKYTAEILNQDGVHIDTVEVEPVTTITEWKIK